MAYRAPERPGCGMVQVTDTSNGWCVGVRQGSSQCRAIAACQLAAAMIASTSCARLLARCSECTKVVKCRAMRSAGVA